MPPRRKLTRHLSMYLPGEVYEELVRQAFAEDRDPLQHARYLIKCGLGLRGMDATAAPLSTHDPEPNRTPCATEPER